MQKYTTIGVLLAGGLSRRFGEAKAFYKLNEKYFFENSIEAAKKHIDQLIIVSHPSLLKSFKSKGNFEVITDHDRYQGLGPLAGIYSAMHHVEANRYLILPCDTPYLEEETISILLEQANRNPNKDAIVPIINGIKQPLIAVYHRSCLNTIQNMLENNLLKMGMLLELVATHYIDEKMFTNLTSFQNINRKEDLNK